MNSGPYPAATRTEDLARSVELATRFLMLVEERDLDAAAELASPDAVFVFPGNARHRSSARRRQRLVRAL